jgi:uncharacterized cupredoxin-like copper-binding protein
MVSEAGRCGRGPLTLRWARHVAGCAALVAALVAATGCSGGASAKASATGSVVRVTESDFRIDARATVPAGAVTLVIHNAGPASHELIVVRLGARDDLPLRADGVTVDEDAIAKATVVNLDPAPPGAERTVHVHLQPGRYMLLCNMEGHYFGGMHRELRVT